MEDKLKDVQNSSAESLINQCCTDDTGKAKDIDVLKKDKEIPKVLDTVVKDMEEKKNERGVYNECAKDIMHFNDNKGHCYDTALKLGKLRIYDNIEDAAAAAGDLASLIEQVHLNYTKDLFKQNVIRSVLALESEQSTINSALIPTPDGKNAVFVTWLRNEETEKVSYEVSWAVKSNAIAEIEMKRYDVIYNLEPYFAFVGGDKAFAKTKWYSPKGLCFSSSSDKYRVVGTYNKSGGNRKTNDCDTVVSVGKLKSNGVRTNTKLHNISAIVAYNMDIGVLNELHAGLNGNPVIDVDHINANTIDSEITNVQIVTAYTNRQLAKLRPILNRFIENFTKTGARIPDVLFVVNKKEALYGNLKENKNSES